MSGGHDKGKQWLPGQLFIIALLVFAMGLLHAFHAGSHEGFDPTGLLALGFVILASYTIGLAVDVIRLPHITGYLLAGLFFGPSIAHMMGLTTAPFDEGILNPEVIEQLALLDTLAVALIGLTAGGELKLEALRRGLKAIVGVLMGQFVAVLTLVTGLVFLIGGAIPMIAFPGLAELGQESVLYIGATIGCISFATSPAATIAIINETRSAGPMSRTVLSAVVLKDVFVVIGFAIFSALAASSMGLGGEGSNIALELLREIGGLLLGGVVLGGVIALYLKFAHKEVLLFLVGAIYTASFVAESLHLGEPIIMFLTAGFVVSNFSRLGHDLIESVERLAMPVYVVFFTLAGAKLHVDALGQVFFFALALFGVRVAAIFVGVRVGARLGRADEMTQRYGWLGFVSQAGVAIALSEAVGHAFGDIGASLGTLLIGGIAMNEVLGPVLLKVGLGLAGEAGRGSDGAIVDEVEAPPEPEAPRVSAPAPTRRARVELPAWPDEAGGPQVWGKPPELGGEADDALVELTLDLQNAVRDFQLGPVEAFRREAELYLRGLRREFLRHHRRLVVQARTGDDRAELATMLRGEEAELAERWRGVILARGATVERGRLPFDKLVETVDFAVDRLPEKIETDYAEKSFIDRPDQGTLLALWRMGLRSRRRIFSGKLSPRAVALRELGSYHLSGIAPSRLEGLAALLVAAERHLASRTRSIFDGIVIGYDELASECRGDETDPLVELAALRQQVDEEIGLALDEVERMARDASRRASGILGGALSNVKTDALVAGTPDLRIHERRSSRVFPKRMKALELLTSQVAGHRKTSGAGYALLAMELELVGLEARIKDVLEEHVSRLEKDVRGKSLVQAERLGESLEEAMQHVEAELDSGLSGDALAVSMRRITELPEKIAGEAARHALELRDSLLDESKLAPLLDALGRAAGSLTRSYDVAVGRIERGEWKLPAVANIIEVPFREAVTTYIEAQIAPELSNQTRALAQRVQPLIHGLSELERLIAFNTELATAELEVVEDDVVPKETLALLREMVAGQLERSETLIAGHIQTAQSWPGEFGGAVRTSILGAFDELRGLLVDGDVSRARFSAMRRKAKRQRLIREAERLPSLLAQAKARLTTALAAVIGEDRLVRYRRVLGLPVGEVKAVLDEVAFTRPEPSADIPTVYRRLFAADTLEAGDVLTGRDDEIARAEKALVGRAGHELRSVALVGVDGVGKAAVSNAIVRGRGWRNVERITLIEPAKVADIDALFTERGEGRLVVVDGLHWMFAMKPGGFEPLRRFVDGVIADAGKNAWLVHADALVWRYAASIASVGEAFPEVVELEPLDSEELHAAVMGRHRLSPYGHAIDWREGEGRIEGLVERGASRFRRPRERYFDELHRATGGLVRDALRLWLASIKEVGSDDIVYVGRIPSSPYAALSRLPEDLLLHLYQIARQGWMNAEVQAHLFRTTESTARAQLARLTHMGLLVREGAVYRVAVHLRGGLVRVLQEKGWVS